jgi:glycine hydroxymethyltransferase
LLVDVTQRKGNSLDMTGKVAEKLLEKIGISTNKNMLPFDPRSPLDPSGIRLGTPAVTTRKMEEEQMYQIAECIDTVLSSLGDEDHIQDCQQRIGELCDSYPLPYQK